MRALLPLLLLAGCGQQAGDDYRFEQRQWTRSSFEVVVVEHPDLASLRKAAPPATGREDIHAFSVLGPGRCTVHVIRPEALDERVWLGHEFAHCAWGQWHPSRGGAFTPGRASVISR